MLFHKGIILWIERKPKDQTKGESQQHGNLEYEQDGTCRIYYIKTINNADPTNKNRGELLVRKDKMLPPL